MRTRGHVITNLLHDDGMHELECEEKENMEPEPKRSLASSLSLILQSIHELNIFTDHCMFACVFGGTYPFEQLASSGLPVRSTKRLSFTLATGEQFSSLYTLVQAPCSLFPRTQAYHQCRINQEHQRPTLETCRRLCTDQLGYSASQESQHPSRRAQGSKLAVTMCSNHSAICEILAVQYIIYWHSEPLI